MNFKEKLRRIKLFLAQEKELKEIEEKIIEKKAELESLKTEAVELKDFIYSNFKEEFKEYDYKVDITNCYIVSLNGKKYVTLRRCESWSSDWYTLATGYYNVERYEYYDALTLDDNNESKYLYEYKYGYFDFSSFEERYVNPRPDYEVHILEVYPELSVFVDNYVPNTYLKKIYYEVNDLGGKNLIKSNSIKKD